MSGAPQGAKWEVRRIVGRQSLAQERAGASPCRSAEVSLAPGTTAADVLRYLRTHKRTWHRLGVIATATGRHPKTVSWALAQLRSLGWVEPCGAGEPQLSSRYLRYRAREPR